MGKVPAPIPRCPICRSLKDLIQHPYGDRLVCDRPVCVYARAKARAEKESAAYDAKWRDVIKMPA